MSCWPVDNVIAWVWRKQKKMQNKNKLYWSLGLG